MSDGGRGQTTGSGRDDDGTNDGLGRGQDPDPADRNAEDVGGGSGEAGPPSRPPQRSAGGSETVSSSAAADSADEPPGGTGESPETATGGGAEAAHAVAAAPGGPSTGVEGEADDVPEDVRTYDRFQKVDRASYDRVNEFLRDRTYVTAREWAIARLCADFRTATGVEMTKIGEHLPELVPFMTDTYSPQAVNQARSAFEEKVRMAGATFLYGAMSGFFTADEVDELMYEVTEVAKFLLEVEGVELTVEEELDAEDRISAVMREVRRASEELRYDDVACPHCGQAFRPEAGDD